MDAAQPLAGRSIWHGLSPASLSTDHQGLAWTQLRPRQLLPARVRGGRSGRRDAEAQASARRSALDLAGLGTVSARAWPWAAHVCDRGRT